MPAGVYKHRPHSAQTRAKMSASHKGLNTWSVGNKNAFKGDRVGYHGVHWWIRKVSGKPDHCENCDGLAEGKRFEWANISGQYLRDLSDWVSLCSRCHRLIDGNMPPWSNAYVAT